MQPKLPVEKNKHVLYVSTSFSVVLK